MDTFKNLNIGSRLALAFGALLLLLVGVGAIGMYGANHNFQDLEEIYQDNNVPLAELGRTNYLLTRSRVLVMDMLLNPAPGNIEKRSAEITANLDSVSQKWKAHTGGHEHPPEEHALFREVDEALKAYTQEGILAARDALRSGKAEDARKIYADKISPQAAVVQKGMDKLLQFQVDESRGPF